MKFGSISPRLVIEVKTTSQSSEKRPEYIAFIPAVLAALVIILGWQVAERYARQKERRADLREAVSAFGTAVTEIVDAASIFYRLPGNDQHAMTLAASIRSQIAVLAEHAEALTDAGLNLSTADVLKRFRQAVTGGEFDSMSRQVVADPGRISAVIALAGQALARNVQASLFNYLYRTSKRRSWGRKA